MFDVIIIGGSHSGLAAALQLARARRTVLIIDAGERRNRKGAGANGCCTSVESGNGPRMRPDADVIALADQTDAARDDVGPLPPLRRRLGLLTLG